MARRKNGLHLLVDADVLRYQIAFANEDKVTWDEGGEEEILTNPEKADSDVECFIDSLLDKFNTRNMTIVLSGAANYRTALYPEYKAQRADKPKPELWNRVSDYLEWGDHGHAVEQWEGIEGDDTLGILHTSKAYRERSVILTIDKDMLTVPGMIYRWNRPHEKIRHQSPRDAAFFHLTQVLTGDAVDNYKGRPGCGDKLAATIRKHAETPMDFWKLIVESYKNPRAFGIRSKVILTEEDAILQAQLAFILRDGWYDMDKQKERLWTPAQLTGI